MTTSNSKVGDDYGAHVGRVCVEHYARLRRYFLIQLGSAPEAERCVEETLYRFFVFAGGCRWEEVAEHVPVHLMRKAAVLCSEKLEERKRLADEGREDDSAVTLRRMAEEAVRVVRERLRVEQRASQGPG